MGEPGAAISYGAARTALRARRRTVRWRWGTDGLGLSNAVHAGPRSWRAPIVGRVCMDQTMVDLDAEHSRGTPGDVVTVLGDDGRRANGPPTITPRLLDTISWHLHLSWERKS
nr:alanine racemase C-terminal domain-containing protein [Kyrpidia tusciae]